MTDFIFTEPKNPWNREDNNLAQTVFFKEAKSRGFAILDQFFVEGITLCVYP